MNIKKCESIKYFDVVLFVALFGSSIIAAKLGHISIGKICLIPLVVYFLRSDARIRFSKNNLPVIIFYISMTISCVIALFRRQLSYFNGYYSTLINYVLQVVIFYFPLIIFLGYKKNRDLLANNFERVLIAVVRVHCYWAIIQELFYFGLDISINDVIFKDFLGGFGLEVWTSYCLFADRLVIRASGINGDPAYLGILLLLGFIFDKNKKLKILYFLVSFLTISRTTILMMGLAFLLYLFYDKSNYSKMIIVLPTLFLLFMLIIFVSPTVASFVLSILSRFDFLKGDVSSWSTSSYIHIMYYPCAISVFVRSGVLKQLFGIGPRIDGIAFTQFSDIIEVLKLDGVRSVSVWCAESDFVGMLLGGGLLGLVSYYYMLIHLWKHSKDYRYKMFCICLAVAGLMYNYYSLTIVNLCFICFQSLCKKNRTGLMPRNMLD